MSKLCNCPRWLIRAGIVVLILGAGLGYIGWERFFRDYGQPAFATPDERFKYGSFGQEYDAGIPYWIFYVLPRVFPDKLPGPGGYASFGVAWEQGHELPIGFTKRRIGFDRVANNCAACHTAAYRASANENPTYVVTGPNHTLNLEAFFRFLVDCAKDPRFNADTLMAEIDLASNMDWLDRMAYRYLIIPITKQRLAAREGQFKWIYRHDFPEWGKGRDDAMNLTKYFMIKWPMDNSIGPTDMPSVWNLKKYVYEKGQRMNFAGDSNDAYSVVIDSALGLLGAAPHNKKDFLSHIDWLVDYLKNKPAPKYPFPYQPNQSSQGKARVRRELRALPCVGAHRHPYPHRRDRHRPRTHRHLEQEGCRRSQQGGERHGHRAPRPGRGTPDRLCRPVSRRHLAAGTLSAQRLGAHAA